MASKFGLSSNDSLRYWQNRFDKQGMETVDYTYHNTKQAESLFEERVKFLFDGKVSCPTNYKTLDMGCGTGRYSSMFNNYIGLDINPDIVKLAKKLNPEKEFYEFKDFILSEQIIKFSPDLLFTSTVFQHCDDELVLKILESLKSIWTRGNVCRYHHFFLYENSQARQPHVCGRSTEEYQKLLSTYFILTEIQSKSHVVHSEKHTVTKAVCFC